MAARARRATTSTRGRVAAVAAAGTASAARSGTNVMLVTMDSHHVAVSVIARVATMAPILSV